MGAAGFGVACRLRWGAPPARARSELRHRVRGGRGAETWVGRELTRSVLAALDQGQQRIVVDCSRWSELDLSALSALVGCARVCGQRGVEFDMTNLTSQLSSAIHALRLGARLGLID